MGQHVFPAEASYEAYRYACGRDVVADALLPAEIRGAFTMTEPAVAFSDAGNIATTLLPGRTTTQAASHQQQLMILVPVDMRLFDGPDEVHMRTNAPNEPGQEQSAFAAVVTA